MSALFPRARTLLLLTFATACAHATGPAARESAFNEQEYAQYAYAGTGTITGQVVVRGEGGRTEPAQGSQVSLNPVTSYSTEWWNRTVVGGLNLRSADEREQKYLRTTTTDADGRFAFRRLSPGRYKLQAWSERSKAPITQDVTIRPGKNDIRVAVAADAVPGPQPDKFGGKRG